MSELQTQMPTETWVAASWDEYVQVIEQPAYEKAKGYYFKRAKRSLYEDLGVAEYWVIDGDQAQILAYAIADQGSKRIQESQVLSGLKIALLEEALRRSWKADQSQVGAWLLTQFQPNLL